jgi:hypothetical protein
MDDLLKRGLGALLRRGFGSHHTHECGNAQPARIPFASPY